MYENLTYIVIDFSSLDALDFWSFIECIHSSLHISVIAYHTLHQLKEK